MLSGFIGTFCLTIFEIVPIGIIGSSGIFSTIDFVPAVCSPAFFNLICINHVASLGRACRSFRNFTVSDSISRCTSFHWRAIDPLIEHLSVFVKEIVFSIYFFLIEVFVHLSIRTEIVPAFFITHISIICMSGNNIVILVRNL